LTLDSEIEPFIPGILDGDITFEAYLERMSHPAAWGGEGEYGEVREEVGVQYNTACVSIIYTACVNRLLLINDFPNDLSDYGKFIVA
jgi:hypothetical protein